MMLHPSLATEQTEPAFHSTSNPSTSLKNAMLRSMSRTARTGMVFSICRCDTAPPSLVPQRLDRIQARGLPRGVQPERDADEGAEADGDQQERRLHEHRPLELRDEV